MKIKPSLRLYFLIIMIITGITTISIMSVASFNYFLTGLDFSVRRAMRAQAYQLPIPADKAINVNNYFIARHWEDLPKPIKDNIDQEDIVENKLVKKVDGNPLFSRPRSGYFVMKLNRGNEVRYIATMFLHPEITREGKNVFPPFINLVLIALIAMTIFAIVPYVILRKVTKPIEKLISWAKRLNKQQIFQPHPDFHYSELNSLAKILQSSLQSVQESLDREQQFLGYASHELRTPIAVTRTNTELLRKMIEKDISKEKQLQVLDRIERASLNMTDLTETLLWLNRKSDKSIPLKHFSIGLLTSQLAAESNYLLNGKNIEVDIQTDDQEYLLPEVLCRIIINNLIRNAFQHTNEGKIIITQIDKKLVIHNQNISQSQIKNELGFGLGLELTERLVKHYDWQYTTIAEQDSHYVEVNFESVN
ncbi:HAMP domain-containing sensor histidine kinase [Psychromonas aquatilis]|uniref:histidine kinase n=1 Tax=Psychromonas aquatilis TaxID=2005072 RepID=A0ABU9GS28_9GAMM